jgi:hypothetical protein
MHPPGIVHHTTQFSPETEQYYTGRYDSTFPQRVGSRKATGQGTPRPSSSIISRPDGVLYPIWKRSQAMNECQYGYSELSANMQLL